MSGLRTKIILLRSKGLTYPEIQNVLGCARSTISYHLNPQGKARMLARQARRRADEPLDRKTENFCAKPPPAHAGEKRGTGKTRFANKIQKFHQDNGSDVPRSAYDFSAADVRAKFGRHPTCYLTGTTLDFDDPGGVSFDHIVPRSRGGENSLTNLGLTTPLANRMKCDMTVDELLEMCAKVLRHHGYTVQPGEVDAGSNPAGVASAETAGVRDEAFIAAVGDLILHRQEERRRGAVPAAPT